MVKVMAYRYFYLVIAEKTNDKHIAEVARGLLSTLEVYESFHLVWRQTDWAKLDERVELSVEEGEEATSPQPPPPPAQIALCGTCKWNYKWTVCEHTDLVTSVFSREY